MSELLKITNVTKKYHHFKALNNVSMTLESGKIIGLLLKDYEGEVLVDGKNVGIDSRKIISYLPDENYFQDWMYIKDVLSIFSDLYEDFDKENCLTLMNRFKLDKGMKIKEMSKGMKEKFQLSLVMSRKAKLYILDEPIAGVDPAAREVILDVILNNYEEDALVLISTHLISDLETIFDDVVFLKDGEIVLHQSTEDLRLERKQSIDEAFREVFRC